MAGKGYEFFFIANLLLQLLCHSATLANVNPPSFVYRSDFREPSNIFNKGMKHLGNNENLIDHVTGDSCTLGTMKNTAFVATSSDEPVARKFGIGLLWSTPGAGQYIYVYKIRATEKFYDVQASLMKAFKDTGSKDYKETAEEFKAEREWVVYHGIPRELIMSASIYTKGIALGTGNFVRTEQNSRYVPANTKANAHAFPVKNQRSVDHYTLMTSNSPDPVSVCFASCPPKKSADAPQKVLTSDGICQMSQIVYRTTLPILKSSFWDPIKRKQSKGLLPWKELTITKGHHTFARPEGCTIEMATTNGVSPFLKINCSKNKFFKRFHVYLRGGIGGKTLFQTKHIGGVAGRTWSKSRREIHLFQRKGNLEDEGYNINEVFSGEEGKWWSEIQILPVFPILRL